MNDSHQDQQAVQNFRFATLVRLYPPVLFAELSVALHGSAADLTDSDFWGS